VIGFRTIAVVALAVVTIAGLPRAASADGADRATAEDLFRAAKRLMQKKQFDEACPKLEESQRLDPQGGTLLNLAVCHARQGRTASAWAEFQEALSLADKAKRRDRKALAQRELKKLEPRLSRLTVEVPPEARVKGLEVRRGDSRLGDAAWGTPVAVDPGELTISASAPGHRPWSTQLKLSEAEDRTVIVPRLAELPPPPKPAPTPEPTRAPEPDPGAGRSTRRTLAYVSGGVGVVALGVGALFGLRAISRNSESDEHCDGSLCSPQGLELNDEANSAATVSNIAFVVAAVGLGAGTVLYLGSEEPERAQAQLRMVPYVGQRDGGILMSGAW
jgi:Tfp pilus assembly protein PilF